MVGEVGEVCELLQWRGDDGAPPGLSEWSADEKTALADELADVLSYVIRIADVTGIDLSEAFLRKLEKNRAKYPAEMVRGSAAKYTEYRKAARQASAAADAASEEAAADAAGSAADAATDAGAEWGAPQRVRDAYSRARARIYGDEPEVSPPPPPPPPPPTASEPPESVAAADEARPSAQQRAQARAEAAFAAMYGERAGGDASEEAATEEVAASSAEPASSGVEFENLDDLFGFMEFGDRGPGGNEDDGGL